MFRLSFIGLFLLLLPITRVISQENNTCPDLVETALRRTDEICRLDAGRNKACYGHSVVDAQPYPDVDKFAFDSPGDRADLLHIESLRLSVMDIETGAWGVAMLNMQVYGDHYSPEQVKFLLFGDVKLQNLVSPAPPIKGTLASDTPLLLAPVDDAENITALEEGQTVHARQRLEDSSWLRVEVPETGLVGWVLADEVLVTGVENLAVVDAWEPYFSPMQVFYFESGQDDAVCSQAPESGLLIQTPEGVAEVNLIINEVNIQLSATAFVQSQPNGNMTIEVISGWAKIETNGASFNAPSGYVVNIPVDGNLTPQGGISYTTVVSQPAIPLWFFDPNAPNYNWTTQTYVPPTPAPVDSSGGVATDGGTTDESVPVVPNNSTSENSSGGGHGHHHGGRHHHDDHHRWDDDDDD